jgi:hypothetical protein
MLQVVLSTAPMVPEPSTEPMAVAGYPPASASAASPVCNLLPVPDLDMVLPPAASPAPKVLPAPQPAVLQLVSPPANAAPVDGTSPAAMDTQPMQPSSGLCLQPSAFSDTLPFAEELAAVAAQLSVSTEPVHVQHLLVCISQSPVSAALTSICCRSAAVGP